MENPPIRCEFYSITKTEEDGWEVQMTISRGPLNILGRVVHMKLTGELLDLISSIQTPRKKK